MYGKKIIHIFNMISQSRRAKIFPTLTKAKTDFMPTQFASYPSYQRERAIRSVTNKIINETNQHTLCT